MQLAWSIGQTNLVIPKVPTLDSSQRLAARVRTVQKLWAPPPPVDFMRCIDIAPKRVHLFQWCTYVRTEACGTFHYSVQIQDLRQTSSHLIHLNVGEGPWLTSILSGNHHDIYIYIYIYIWSRPRKKWLYVAKCGLPIIKKPATYTFIIWKFSLTGGPIIYASYTSTRPYHILYDSPPPQQKKPACSNIGVTHLGYLRVCRIMYTDVEDPPAKSKTSVTLVHQVNGVTSGVTSGVASGVTSGVTSGVSVTFIQAQDLHYVGRL